MTPQAEFELWFVDSLSPIRDNPHAGFVLAIVAFPLLERYLREKSGIGEGQLTQPFYAALHSALPELGTTAQDLYSTYRNGLLHQAVFSLQTTKGRIRTLPKAALSGYDERPVYHDVGDDTFYMNPRAFYDRVIATILSDFSTYEGSLSK